MSDFWLIRHGNTLISHTAESQETISRLPFGKPLQATIKQPRNGRHSALYWVLCHRIAAAVGSEPENISDLLKVETGHCEIIRSKKYGELRLPRSISFSKMNQTDFSIFFENCLRIIYSNWAIEREDILATIGDLLEPKAEMR